MKHILKRCFAALCGIALLLAFAPGIALADPETSPVLYEAQGAVITDEVGNVLYSLNPELELPMASITKIMTAMVALDSGIDLDTPCTIHDVYLGEDSQTAGYTESDTPTLRELLRVMLVYSGNDCAENVAINVAGSEEAFVELMNQKAQELGMTHTHFMNPHGMDEEGHYSCAADLAVMGRVALTEYPFIASTVRLRSVTGTVGGYETVFYSTDDLMGSYEGMLGIKTGSVYAGTAFLGAARRDGVTLYTAVLGCATTSGRFTDTESMLDWAFDTYKVMHTSNETWIVDVVPYAYDFRYKCVVTPHTEGRFEVWPQGGSLTYRSTRITRDMLMTCGEATGITRWSQAGRPVADTVYQTSGVPLRVPAVGIFELPLFCAIDTVGLAS